MASEVMITQEEWDAQKAALGITTNGNARRRRWRPGD